MREYLDTFEWAEDAPNTGTHGAPGHVRMLGGFNPAANLHLDNYVRWFSPMNALDRESLIANPAAPAAGDGTDWRSSTIGGASTMSFTTGFPSALRIVTAATDGQGTQFQMVVNGANFDMQVGSFLKTAFMAITMRVNDITQSEFFVGFAPSDTNIFSTIDDFVGISKADDSTLLKLVASGTSVASPDAAGTVATIADLASLDALGASAASDYLTLILRIRDRKAYAGVQNDREISAGRRIAAHRATIALPTLGAASTPTFGVLAGSAAARTYDIASIGIGARYALGGRVRA